MRSILPAALAIAAYVLPQTATAESALVATAAYEHSQAAIGRMVGPHELDSYDGTALSLAELRGRPLVISLVFTSCSTVCPLSTAHLRDSVIKARRALGRDSFSVLTFGFDASRDRPTQLRAFARTHDLIGVGNWHIASADTETTMELLDDLGFSWRASAGSFDHVTQTSILDSQGRVYRQIYGEAFPLPVLVEPMKDLVLGTITRSVAPADLWDRLTFLCTVYNPLTGAYRFDYGIFFGVAIGGMSLVLTGVVILRLWIGNRRAARDWPERAA